MQNNTPDALTAFLTEPLISGIVAAAPALTTRATAARAAFAALVKERDAARASASSGAPVAAIDGAAPIVRTTWEPETYAVDPTYHIPADMAALLSAALDARIPVLMTGPQGTGKTEAAQYAAARAGRPCYVIDCGPVRDAADWFGSPTLIGGRGAWQDSAFVAALATPSAVIVFDELNRSHTTAHSALLPMLDRRRRVVFPQRSEPVAVAEGVSVIATANVGIHHVGTSAITPALLSRFQEIPTDYLTESQESALIIERFPKIPRGFAENLARVASATRSPHWLQQGGQPISTREALATAALAVALDSQGADRALAVRCLIAKQPDDNHGGPSPRAQLAALAAREIGMTF